VDPDSDSLGDNDVTAKVRSDLFGEPSRSTNRRRNGHASRLKGVVAGRIGRDEAQRLGELACIG